MSDAPPFRYIVVEGVIGVGKTTLVRALADAFDARTVLEVFDENGEEFFYVADGGWMVRGDDGKASREQGRVSKITTDGKHVFTIGHPVTVGAYEPGERFQPCDVAVAPSTGDVYVADYCNHTIRKICSTTQQVFTIGGSCGEQGHRDGERQQTPEYVRTTPHRREFSPIFAA